MKRIDPTVRCDKPYDLDAADKRNGKPRRKRRDSHATAYELVVRLDRDQSALMGKRKIVRTVYALNKKRDLAAKVEDFEAETSRRIREAAIGAGFAIEGEGLTVDYVMDAYLKSREGRTVSAYARDSRQIHERYISPAIGGVLFDDLTVKDVNDMLEAIPERSRSLNLARRARQEEHRRTMGGGSGKPFKPIGIAGRPTQHKALALLREAGGYALDMELATVNVAASRRLAKQFPKSKPKIDNWTDDEIKYIYSKIQELPLGPAKIEFQLLVTCGMRPGEVRALTFADVSNYNGQPILHVTKRNKTENGNRAIPLDPDTAGLIAAWKESRKKHAAECGLVFGDEWTICSENGEEAVGNTLVKRWRTFLEKINLEHRRPYSLRHTFATVNCQKVDAKTLSTLMGHASPGFTLQVYAGYTPSSALPVTADYRDFLAEGEGPQSDADNDEADK